MIDVGIIGGGPAGASTAIALARTGRSVALFERSGYDAIRVGETLPPRARPLLDKLSVTAHLPRDGHLPASGIVTAWGDSHPQSNDFIVNPYGHGWHLDRARFDHMLAARALEAGATVYERTAVTACDSVADHWQLATRSATGTGADSCRFIIDATGRRVTDIKRRAGRRAVHDGLVGIAAFTTASPSGDQRTLIEATSGGWWYSAPLPFNQHVTVYMTDADTIRVEQRDLLRLLKRELPHAPLTRERCGDFNGPTRVTASAAMTSRYEHVHGRNWLLVGDAAMTWDPLSGQGICKALESGIRAAQAIDRALDGNDEGLDDYAQWTNTQFSDYIRIRAKYYAAEERWPDAPFWRRRHLASDT